MQRRRCARRLRDKLEACFEGFMLNPTLSLLFDDSGEAMVADIEASTLLSALKAKPKGIHLLGRFWWCMTPSTDVRGDWILQQFEGGTWCLCMNRTDRHRPTVRMAACVWSGASPQDAAMFLFRLFLEAAKCRKVSFGYDEIESEGIIDVHALVTAVLHPTT